MNHGFVDGNKRTAVAALEIFLNRNGYEVEMAEWWLESEFFRAVAAGEQSRGDLEDWICVRTTPSLERRFSSEEREGKD